MRNPSRIYPLLNKIADIWLRNPDLRFDQLINNIQNQNKIENLFYIEDNEFENLIDKYCKNTENT